MPNYTEKDRDTLNKISWEGGVIDALEYGIKHDDFDNKELRRIWRMLESYGKEIGNLSRIIDQAIKEVAND